MFKRENRLPARTRLSQARFLTHPFFRLKVGVNNLSINRYAFVVKKSVDKRAVYRNRIRRLFRSCVEDLALEIKPGQDMLFFLEKGIIDQPKEELQKVVGEFLRKNQLLDETARA